MASVSGDGIRPMFQDALEMLRLTWASFRRHDVSALEKAAMLGESIHAREKELTRLLLAQSASEQLHFVPGHLERIGDAIEGLLRCLHTMQAEGTLFTDRGVREVNTLFGKAVELIECARDLMFTGNRVLAAHVAGEGDRFPELADECARAHEERPSRASACRAHRAPTSRFSTTSGKWCGTPVASRNVWPRPPSRPAPEEER